ncbi:hypothetical protein EV363DRAFT_1339240 [Boletus edulis]|uniref:Uncharacterized protein n=1 Tax=Boletus edulis BED1 TaxID=1328754 RepID=A0AAD4C9D3_BOLED|nr:hypothetical protein EV363DRAFT_1339240 [Boletus edulis]KAF8452358.1 hypothetical protein L210DRAFT_3518268 [Boletus edulis BED1]
MDIALDHYDKASMDTSEMDMLSSAMDRDSDHCSPDLDMPLPQWHRKVPRAVKRKMDDHQVEEMPSVGVKIKRSALPPKKKVKREDASAPLLYAFPDPTLDYISSACTTLPQPLQRRRVGNEGYLCEAIKKSYEYTTKDLPIPCDKRWSHAFISTAMLWYSVQKNVWNVPTEEFASALQRIFNVVYPDVKYMVTPAGSVFALALQRIDEWRYSFGSSALAMMLHFFSSLDDDDRVRSAAEFLATDFRFLREDPDSSEPTEMFRSPFLLILIAITHLSDIAAFVDVPGWDTQAMAAGKGGEGVIAIASAALERAMTLFCEGTVDVNLLTETARCLDAPPALRFSSVKWSSPTAAYREAVRKRETEFVCGLFAAAQAKRPRIARDDDSEANAGVSVSGVPDPRSLL